MFHLWAGDNYYPQGGLGDYKGFFEAQEDAEGEGIRLTRVKHGQYTHCDWWEVGMIDTDGELVRVSAGNSHI